MTNTERIQANNAELRECIEIAEGLPQDRYEDGLQEGYTKGHADGVNDGIEQGYNSGMDAIVTKTVVYYRNDTLGGFMPSFANFTNLETLIMPKITHLNGLSGCSALKYCDFSNAQYIQSSAFQNCVSLEELDLPSAVQIHSNVFAGCTSLTTLILRQTAGVTSLGSTGSFANTPIANGTGYIYVPASRVETYKSATNWSIYAEQIRAIEDYPEITG